MQNITGIQETFYIWTKAAFSGVTLRSSYEHSVLGVCAQRRVGMGRRSLWGQPCQQEVSLPSSPTQPVTGREGCQNLTSGQLASMEKGTPRCSNQRKCFLGALFVSPRRRKSRRGKWVAGNGQQSLANSFCFSGSHSSYLCGNGDCHGQIVVTVPAKLISLEAHPLPCCRQHC